MKFAVLGDPIAHSKSPAMHRSAYRALGMKHDYEAIRATRDDLADLIARLRTGDFAGFNVTVPDKEAILAHVDVIDESARVVSAANTIVRRADGKIVAYNTDVPALADELRALGSDLGADEWKKGAGIILGAGGAARAAVASLARHLAVKRVIVRARAFEERTAREEFRERVASVIGQTELVTEALASPGEAECEACVVIQATSAGMDGAAAGDAVARAIDFTKLPPRAVALDVIYAPPRTPFIAAAEKAGIRATNGLGMLARQGALAFELWLGVPAPYNAMLAAIV